jgi:spore coat polysaccharide biosynthesis predicted glycosyltransferase SpsG
LNKNHNILICPLEWGLGHAARMIPLAKKLLETDNHVFIASGQEHLSLFRNELPEVLCIDFPGFKPVYSRFLPQYISLLLKTPLLVFHIIREHYRLKKLIQKYAVDIVISDNRFGLWNRNVTTAYVTHMPLIPLPKPLRFLEGIGIILHRAVIKRYSFCFIPDLPGELNVSGRLSHGIRLPENVRYIGILSRFLFEEGFSPKDEKPLHNTVILSGPEPQRRILKENLISLLKDKKPMTIMLEGRPVKTVEEVRSGNIVFYNHLRSPEMKEVITGSEIIITRSGYSTIMELISLKCSALLIPTPGQTEQEYLAEYLSEKGWFSTISQGELRKGVPDSIDIVLRSDEIIRESTILLTNALAELLDEPHNKPEPKRAGKESEPYLPGSM